MAVKVLKVGTVSSGFFQEEGHAGRPGFVGGSRSASGRATDMSPEAVERRTRYAAAERARWAKLNEKWEKWGVTDPDDKKNIVKVLKEATGGKFKGHPVDFIQRTWEVKDPDGGQRSEITSIEYNDFGGDHGHISVYGKIYEEGNDWHIGRFERTINDDGEIHNDYFSIDENKTGTGFGNKFYRNAEVRLKKAGFKKITIGANIDVGGYAWARMGFDFSSEWERDSFRDGFKRFWDRSTPNLPFPEINHAWDIAAADNGNTYDKDVRGKAGKHHAGKYYMLGQSWSAVKYLDDSNPTWRVGEAYYEEKAKKKGKMKL